MADRSFSPVFPACYANIIEKRMSTSFHRCQHISTTFIDDYVFQRISICHCLSKVSTYDMSLTIFQPFKRISSSFILCQHLCNVSSNVSVFHVSVVCQRISFVSTNVNVFQVSVPMELPPLPDSGTILLIRPSDALPPVKEARLPVSLCNHPVRCSHHAQVHGPRPVRISHPQCGDLPWPLSPGPLPLNDGLLPLADLLASGAG